MAAISSNSMITPFPDLETGSYPGSLLDPVGGSLSATPATTPGLWDQAKTAVAGAGPALAVMGLVTGAIGSFFSAQSQKSSMQFQASMSQINARMAEQQAQSILSAGQQQVAQITLRAGRLKSAQRVAVAANGVSLSGSPTVDRLLTDTDYFKEADAMTVSANAMRSAAAARAQFTNASNQALMLGAGAQQISPLQAGMTSLLGGAGQVAQALRPSNRNLSALSSVSAD